MKRISPQHKRTSRKVELKGIGVFQKSKPKFITDANKGWVKQAPNLENTRAHSAEYRRNIKTNFIIPYLNKAIAF